MVLNIFSTLFVLGITFMHSIFGAFSGLINLFCTVTAMCIAFGFYESLAVSLAKMGIHPNYAAAVCFLGLFVISLIVLRLAADNLIRGNVRVPMAADWGVAGVCGFFNGMIAVGVLVIAVNLLPFGGGLMMYRPVVRTEVVDSNKRVEFERRHLWLRPDEFAAGLFSMLSSGSLSGQTSFASVYPDYTQWVGWTGNTVQKESLTAPVRDKEGDGVKEGLDVLTWWEVKSAPEGRYRKELPSHEKNEPPYERQTYTPGPGMRLIATRLDLRRAAADRDRSGDYHRFRPTMIRVVGKRANGEYADYAARLLGGVDINIPDSLRIADPDNNFAINADGDTTVDAYFEVDQDFKPEFVEYRRLARAAVGAPAEKALPMLVAKPREATGEGDSQTGSGPSRFFDVMLRDQSGDKADLPFRMALNRLQSSSEVEIQNGKLAAGRISGDAPGFRAAGGATEVSEFFVPEGYRMLQVRMKSEKAASMFGRTFDYVAGRVNQYRAVDNNGDPHMLDGYYAIVQRGEQQVFEIFYPGKPAADAAYNSMLDFKEIKPNELQHPEAELTLIFLVKPGTHIIKIENQAGAGVSFEPGIKVNTQ